MEETTLKIKIENKNPVELNQLTLSLNALALQYDSFIKNNGEFNYTKIERKLYISKIKQGSIEMELISSSIALPLIEKFNVNR